MPLYVYLENSNQGQITINEKRTPNLNPKILRQIEEKVGLTFVPEKAEAGNVCMANSSEVRDEYKATFAPIDILDYIYSVLHSPTYRDKYEEFLKIDFPRVPYPKDPKTFWQLVELGSQLRQLHLMESPKTEEYITSYPKDGSNEITTKIGKKDWKLFDTDNQFGRIWINDTWLFRSDGATCFGQTVPL